MRDYLITQKSIQKKHHDRIHNTRYLPELHAGEPVLFLIPADANSYIEGYHYRTIHFTSQLHDRSYKAAYIAETDITSTPYTQTQHPFQRPSTHQGNAQFQGHQNNKIPSFQDLTVRKVAPLQDHLQEHHHKPPVLLKKTQLNSLIKAACLPYSTKPLQAAIQQPITL